MFKNNRKLLFCTLLLASWCASAETIVQSNTVIGSGQSVYSENAKYFLVMQTDGNLVMYRNDGVVRFATYKLGNYAVMQSDGNFVEYTSSNQSVWNTYTSGNPGAVLAVQNDGNLVVYRNGTALWSIGADPANGGNPSFPGDVVGRNMSPPLGPLGHLGIWNGQKVAEVGPWGGGNAIRFTSFSDFKNATTYWGAASANIPYYYVLWCFEKYCTDYFKQTQKVPVRLAIANRIYQAYLIGADYTIQPTYVSAQPGNYYNPLQRGTYRCDTFVLDMLGISVSNLNSSSNEPIDPTWQSRYWNMWNGPRSPTTIFNTLKTFN